MAAAFNDRRRQWQWRWRTSLLRGCYMITLDFSIGAAYHSQTPRSTARPIAPRPSARLDGWPNRRLSSLAQAQAAQHPPPSLSSPSGKSRRPGPLGALSADAEVPEIGDGGVPDASFRGDSDCRLSLSWRDALTLSIHSAACLLTAVVVSTYEDYDVTHVRPSPSTLRRPPAAAHEASLLGPGGSFWGSHDRLDFVGAATRGMGWGYSDRAEGGNGMEVSFEDWYGTGASTLRWKPSYNEVMLRHRSERVPRWRSSPRTAKDSKDDLSEVDTGWLREAVAQLYRSLDELDELKAMADEYAWDEMRERLDPSVTSLTGGVVGTRANGRPSGPALTTALEYSMDVLKSAPFWQSQQSPHAAPSTPSRRVIPRGGSDASDLPELIGFDWGSCAWRHCGAKADAQEAVAELYGSLGMLEPFECRFILDIIERSVRDVLAVVPKDLKPTENGSPLEIKPYVQYVPLAGSDEEKMGIDYEYTQALSDLRVDLSLEK